MQPPRVLLYSTRGFRRWKIMCDHFESEDVIASVDRVDLASPTAVSRGQSRASRGLRKALQRLAGVDIRMEGRVGRVRVERRYDLFFFRIAALHDLALLKSIPEWREQCTTAVCWIDELWAKQLDGGLSPTTLFHSHEVGVLNQFDHVILPFSGSTDALARLIRPAVHWMPFGIDTLRFAPWPKTPKRVIDLLSMGRKAPTTHQALLRYCDERNWMYSFDTYQVSDVYDPIEHRNRFADTIKRARFFVTNRAKVDQPLQTAGQHEFGFRFLEGASAGAILIGELPRSRAFEQCFNWPDAAFNLPFDSSDIEALLDELSEDPERMQRISFENIRQCLLAHDWAYRWRDILALAGLPTDRRLDERLSRLAALAAEIPERTRNSRTGTRGRDSAGHAFEARKQPAAEPA